MKWWLILVLFFVVDNLFSQTDSIDINPIDETLEEYIESSGDEGEFQFDGFQDALVYYHKHPISLNKATQEALESSNLFTDLQINSLISYRQKYGKLITIYELQAIPNFSLADIRKLLPYIKVNGAIDDLNMSFKEMITKGQNEVFLRWGRNLQVSDGYKINEKDNTIPFEGSRDLLYFRFRHQFSNRFRFGLTAEKDAGESFFKGSNTQGFDYYSFHVYLKKYNKYIKALAIGDYAVKLGQGLILFNGFGLGKGSEVMNIRRTSIPINPYSSVGETQFYRGAGAQLGLTKNIDLTVFASSKRRDASLLEADTLIHEDIALFSSFVNSGYHRTASEIEKESVLGHQVIGGSLKFKKRQGHIAINSVYNQFDKTLNLKKKLYNQFYFQGKQLFNASIDYSYVYKNVMLFGESAMSDNKALAHIVGLNVSLDRHVSLAALYRDLGVKYQTIDGRVFGTSTRVNNNKGMYVGIQIVPDYHWKLSGYFDVFEYPWLRSRTSSPSVGYDYLVRIDYRQKRKFNAYVKFRYVNASQNTKNKITEDRFIGNINLYRLRIHVSNKVLPNIELRNRLEISLYDDGINPGETGFLIYQDVLWKRIMESRFSLASRFAIFDTQGNNSRIYTFESDIQGSHYIPAYRDKGIRTYLKLSYKGIPGLTIESRYALFWYKNLEEISSGDSRIDGNIKSEIKLQFIYRW